MAFPPKLLNDNEDIVTDLRPHWWMLAKPVMAVVLAVVAALLVPGAIGGRVGDFAFYAIGVVAVFFVLWMIAAWLRWTTTSFVVTTERLIFRAGIVAKRGMEIPLERVNNIAFNQSVTERVIGKGDLLIESGGEQGQQHFTDIPRPQQVQNDIYRQMEAAAARDADRIAGRRELSIPEQIDKLDDLRQRGVITQAEFDGKKRQLLDRL